METDKQRARKQRRKDGAKMASKIGKEVGRSRKLAEEAKSAKMEDDEETQATKR